MGFMGIRACCDDHILRLESLMTAKHCFQVTITPLAVSEHAQ